MSASLNGYMPRKKRIERTKDMPATYGMLEAVRAELKSDIAALSAKFDANFKSVDSKFKGIDSKFKVLDSKFASIDSKFTSLDSRFGYIDSKFASIDSRFDALDSKLHNMHLLMEEQNQRNKIVRDGLSSLFQRQEKSESRLDDLENFIARAKKS